MLFLSIIVIVLLAVTSASAQMLTAATVRGERVVVDLSGTPLATGALITNVGHTGSESAGLVLRSAANGMGTGIRIGGPSGSDRPTLSTGIDITGGTGVRYNALSSGIGTALDVGGTTPPLRGIDIVVAGNDHVGVSVRGNLNGNAIVGSILSATSDPPFPMLRTGVRGHAASNGNTAADSILGTVGTVVRGGNGGTLTTSIAVAGYASSLGTSHSGLTIGVKGMAQVGTEGLGLAIGGFFSAPPSPRSLALLVTGGDVVLGTRADVKPNLYLPSISDLTWNNPTTTWMYHSVVSGTMRLVAAPLGLVQGRNDNVNLPPACILRCTGVDTEIGGLVPTSNQCVVLYAIDDDVTVVHNAATSLLEHRFLLPNAVDVVIPQHGSMSFWYDGISQRWRILGGGL